MLETDVCLAASPGIAKYTGIKGSSFVLCQQEILWNINQEGEFRHRKRTNHFLFSILYCICTRYFGIAVGCGHQQQLPSKLAWQQQQAAPPSAQRLDANYSASMPDLEKC